MSVLNFNQLDGIATLDNIDNTLLSINGVKNILSDLKQISSMEVDKDIDRLILKAMDTYVFNDYYKVNEDFPNYKVVIPSEDIEDYVPSHLTHIDNFIIAGQVISKLKQIGGVSVEMFMGKYRQPAKITIEGENNEDIGFIVLSCYTN